MQIQKMDRERKNQYIRFLLRILHEKYHVNISSLGRDIGFQDKYFRMFYSAARDYNLENLDKIEEYLAEMYAGLLDVDIEMHVPMIKRLLEESNQGQGSLFESNDEN